MSVRLPLARLLFLLAVWMLGCAAACGLIYLSTDTPASAVPHRTRPPR
jgi:uncharacterized membrane protein